MPVTSPARTVGGRRSWCTSLGATTTCWVLEHTADYPDAGIQVPAGGVDPGESTESAAIRELFEETGLQAGTPAVYLQSCWWPSSEAPSRIRHYYWLAVPAATPAAWSHVVSGGEQDKGMTFILRFRPLAGPNLTPGYGWEEALPRLLSVMNADDRC